MERFPKTPPSSEGFMADPISNMDLPRSHDGGWEIVQNRNGGFEAGGGEGVMAEGCDRPIGHGIAED
ncbi:hypothetical protein CCHR01_19562 [Colletotrichum chrysophilum]|uniref:Uncharacterized protein n=1 Tax=Colletotrichum chrysophilum TaxID=1836956 RepID=A0AAD8ZY27_9PEZI|nr:hypothetical protein CCHR01_19562 [Colletotrichum chrysophilum]